MGEEKDHEELLEIVLKSEAKIMISSYESDLYNAYLKGWTKVKMSSCAEYAGSRIETIYMNYEMGRQMTLDEYNL